MHNGLEERLYLFIYLIFLIDLDLKPFDYSESEIALNLARILVN